MKALLEAVKDRLKAELGWVASLHVLPDRALVPNSASFPAVGLKDGAIGVEHGISESYEAALAVEVTCYLRPVHYETVIMGAGTDKGILDLAADVRAALDAWDPDGYFAGTWTGEDASELIFFTETTLLLGKTIHFTWQKQGVTGG